MDTSFDICLGEKYMPRCPQSDTVFRVNFLTLERALPEPPVRYTIVNVMATKLADVNVVARTTPGFELLFRLRLKALLSIFFGLKVPECYHKWLVIHYDDLANSLANEEIKTIAEHYETSIATRGKKAVAAFNTADIQFGFVRHNQWVKNLPTTC